MCIQFIGCAHVHMCALAHGSMHAFMGTGKPEFSFKWSLPKTWSSPLQIAWQANEFQGPIVLWPLKYPTAPGAAAKCYTPNVYYMGAGDSNSGPPACTAKLPVN